MKKILVALALVAAAGTASANIAGSKHDMTTFGGTLGSCQYCHAPHWSNTTVAGAPLWNRNLTAATSYTLYSSATLAVNPTTVNINSLTCLSCHDNTTNIGTVYAGTGDALGTISTLPGVAATSVIGLDLRNDHPVSVPYPVAATDFVATAPLAGLPLYGGNVECASCHDPHVTTNGYFLRDTRAALCADCHTK